MKLAIIGAGPAGLYAALAAAKKNIKADLFEKRHVGKGIVCGECIFDSLGIMPKPGKGLLHLVDEIVLKGRKEYIFPMRRHRKLWMMDRKTWQQELAQMASARGVAVHEGAKISQEQLCQMKEKYDWIIDASGAPSVTSRAYKFSHNYFEEYLLARQVVLSADFSSLFPRIKIAFFPNLQPCFQPAYYWVFPKDDHRANVGVVCTVHGSIARDKLDLKKLLADVIIEEGLAGASILETGSGIASGRLLPQLAYDNILLAGDAAGLPSPLHGGGIDMACLSGVLAVESLAGGKKGPANYEKKLKRYIREKLGVEQITIAKMRTSSFYEFDELLSGVTSSSNVMRAKTALRHPDLLYATYKWLRKKEASPNWPDPG